MTWLRRHNVNEGDRFGRLVVVSGLVKIATSSRSKYSVECICDCGNIKFASPKNLIYGQLKSCGCLKKDSFEKAHKANTKHGESKKPTTEYRSWVSMKERCLNPLSASYFRYGAVGVRICGRWLDSYENFLEDMGRKPDPTFTIDRIDGSKGYFPENCKWASKKEQAHNRSSTKWIEFNGQNLPIVEWARKIGVHKSTILVRLRNGWSVERALTKVSPHVERK